MISLKSLMKSMKDSRIVSPREGVNTPMEAKIQISEYGVMTRGQMKKNMVRFVSEVSKYVRNGESNKAFSLLYGKKMFREMLETDIKHSGELNEQEKL